MQLSGQHQSVNPAREIIEEYFRPAAEGEGKHMTATQILAYLAGKSAALRLNGITIGKELTNLGFERVSSGRGYGYWVKDLKPGLC